MQPAKKHPGFQKRELLEKGGELRRTTGIKETMFDRNENVISFNCLFNDPQCIKVDFSNRNVLREDLSYQNHTTLTYYSIS